MATVTSNTGQATIAVNEAISLSLFSKSYLDFCDREFFGLRSFEQSERLLKSIQRQLALLASGKYPVHIFSHRNKLQFLNDAITEWYLKSNVADVVSLNLIRFSESENFSHRYAGAAVLIFLAVDADDLLYFKRHAIYLQAQYPNCILYSTERAEDAGEFHLFNNFRYNHVFVRQALDQKLVGRHLTIELSKKIARDFNKISNKYAAFLWSQHMQCLKKVDQDIDREMLLVERKLRVASIENPSGVFSSSAAGSISSIKSTLEKYMRDTAADFQKKAHALLDNTFNAESGSLAESLTQEIEDMNTAALKQKQSPKNKDIEEVSLDNDHVAYLQNKIDRVIAEVFNERVRKDIEKKFKGIVGDINRDLATHKLGSISSSNVNLIVEQRLNNTIIEKTIGCNYVAETSYIGKRGVFSKIKAVREGAFQLMIFVMLLGFLNPHVDFTYRKVITYKAINEKGIDNTVDIFINGDVVDTTVMGKDVKVAPVTTTVIGELAFLMKHGKWFSSTKNNMLIPDDIELVQGKPMDILGRGSLIGMIIAVILMGLSYFDYRQRNKQFTDDETEKHLRNIKNELKSSVKKACQNVNRATRDFVNDCFAGITGDIMQDLEILKQQSDEREKEAVAVKNEQLQQLKYIKLKQAELLKFKGTNKTKSDEFEKIKVSHL